MFSLAFCCVVTGISEFDQKKAAEVALATVRLWLESNHSSVDCVIFCACENEDYEIYKDLMSMVYFPVSRIRLTGNYMKKTQRLCSECENLSQWQIYPSTKSPGESFKRISGKIDFNAVRDSNILIGLINYGENVCFFNSVVQVLYYLPLFRDYINKLRPPVKGVALKVRKLFRVIETSNEPARTSNYVKYLSLQCCELGMQYDACECLLQLLAKIYPNINDDCMFKIGKLELTLCNDCGHTVDNDVLTGLYT